MSAAAASPDPFTENNVLTIRTLQIAPFRTLMTALKDILLETNICFNQEGIKVTNFDKSHTIVAHLNLARENFEYYECKQEQIIIGVNMYHLFKLINSVDSEDTLTIYIENKDFTDGIVSHLGLKFENGKIKQRKTQKLRLIEPEEEELEYPQPEFSSIINLPSQDFQKIIRNLSDISDKLEIESVGDELIFRCEGQFATVEIRRAESDNNMSFVSKQDASKVMTGVFSLKNLSYFIKCTNLCNHIELHLENDLPLVVKYSVASLGELRLCLAPLPSV